MFNFLRKKPSPESVAATNDTEVSQISSDIVLIIETEFWRILLRHIKTLVTKYEQAIYRDDYGNVELDGAEQEISYFINKTLKNGLLSAPLPNSIPRETFLNVLVDMLNYPDIQSEWKEKIEEFLDIYDEEGFIDSISSIASGYTIYLNVVEGSEETLSFLLGDNWKSFIEMTRVAIAENQTIKIGSVMSHLIDLNNLSNLQKWFSERHKNSIDLTSVKTGQEFEIFCQRQLENLGWSVRTTRTTGDFGADLVIEKENISIIVQCKFYSQPVGVKAVQEVFSAMTFYNAQKSVVVSNNSFTKAARQMAEKNNVMLLNMNELEKLAS